MLPIFFFAKTRSYFMYLSSQKSLTRRIRCRLFWTSLFEVLTSYFKSGRHLLPERKVDKFQSHTKTECSSICYFGEGGSSRVKFLMNPMNKLNKQPRIAGRFRNVIITLLQNMYRKSAHQKKCDNIEIHRENKINEI